MLFLTFLFFFAVASAHFLIVIVKSPRQDPMHSTTCYMWKGLSNWIPFLELTNLRVDLILAFLWSEFYFHPTETWLRARKYSIIQMPSRRRQNGVYLASKWSRNRMPAPTVMLSSCSQYYPTLSWEIWKKVNPVAKLHLFLKTEVPFGFMSKNSQTIPLDFVSYLCMLLNVNFKQLTRRKLCPYMKTQTDVKPTPSDCHLQ